jgi:hypothetical protein
VPPACFSLEARSWSRPVIARRAFGGGTRSRSSARRRSRARCFARASARALPSSPGRGRARPTAKAHLTRNESCRARSAAAVNGQLSACVGDREMATTRGRNVPPPARTLRDRRGSGQFESACNQIRQAGPSSSPSIAGSVACGCRDLSKMPGRRARAGAGGSLISLTSGEPPGSFRVVKPRSFLDGGSMMRHSVGTLFVDHHPERRG